MSQNNEDDLNMQTFQIYQDDPKPKSNVEPLVKSNSKGKATKTSSSNFSDLTKGLLIGLIIAAAFIAFDMFIL